MLIDSQSKIYEKPETGVYDAVFADYVDLGLVTTTFKGVSKTQKMVRLFWVLNAKDSEGNYFQVVKRVAASMFQKSNLYKVVKGMIDKEPVLSGPLGSFELEDLIGMNNQLVVKKEVKPDGKVYANIDSFLPAKVKFQVPTTFVRKKDQKDNYTVPAQAAASGAPPAASPATIQQQAIAEDEDIPF